MPKDMYEGDRIAANAWGEAARDMSKGMMDLGESLVKLERTATDSKDYADLQEGRAKIQEEAAAHDEFRLENLNPLEWVRNLDKHVGNAVKWVAGGMRSPRVNAQLQRDVRQMADQGQLQHGFDWAALQVRRATEAHAGKVQRAVESGSIQELEEATREGVEMELTSPPMAKAVYENGVQQIYAGRRAKWVEEAPDEVLKYALNPEAEEMPEEFADMSPSIWADLRREAQASQYARQRPVVEQFREARRSGMIASDRQAEAWIEMHVPEGMRDATMDELLQRTLQGGNNDPEEYSRLRAAARAYNPKAAYARVREQRQRLLHAQFPAERQAELDEVLDAQIRHGRAEPLVMQSGRALIQKLHRDQLVPNAEGRVLTYLRASGSAGEDPAIDEKMRAESALIALQLEDDLEEEVQQRGNMTDTDVKQWVSARILPAVLSRGAAAVLQRLVIPKEHVNSPAPGGPLGRLQAALSKPEPKRSR